MRVLAAVFVSDRGLPRRPARLPAGTRRVVSCAATSVGHRGRTCRGAARRLERSGWAPGPRAGRATRGCPIERQRAGACTINMRRARRTESATRSPGPRPPAGAPNSAACHIPKGTFVLLARSSGFSFPLALRISCLSTTLGALAVARATGTVAVAVAVWHSYWQVLVALAPSPWPECAPMSLAEAP